MKHLTITAIALTLVLSACGTEGSQPQNEASPTPQPSIDRDAPLEEQWTAAIRNGDVELVSSLVTAGAALDVDLEGGYTPLHLAVARSQVEIAQMLVAAGAPLEETTSTGMTPLHLAASGNASADMLDVLIGAGADINRTNIAFRNATALHYASRDGSHEAVQALIAAGVDVDQTEDTNSTALMYAAYYGHGSIVSALLAAGADVEILDDGGHTAHYWAVAQGFTEIAGEIAAAGGGASD